MASCDIHFYFYIVFMNDDSFKPVEGGLAYANELVALVRDEFPHFGMAVAGYPEKHREAVSLEVDLENLKRKVDTGADIIITQLFYKNEDFFRFVDLCRDAGINIPIVPGILPVVKLNQIRRIATLCDASLPQEFVDQLEAGGDDDQAQLETCVGRRI